MQMATHPGLASALTAALSVGVAPLAVASAVEDALRPASRTAVRTCAFTVDVEDWYQSCIDVEAPITDRVVRNVDRVRELLDECGIKGTFFMQGRVAEAYPRMVQELVAEGHEIQSHGYSHRPLYALSRADLRDELERARGSVEDACGVKVSAFRAPDFSIHAENLWALDVLAECGFTVDSSIFPLRTARYGIANWGLDPRWVPLQSGRQILEVPVAIGKVGPLQIPVAGGGYFRLLPQALLDLSLRSILAEERPVVIYCHPYEFNPTEMNDYRGKVSALYRMHQSVGRPSMVRRLRALLTTLPFGRFDEVVAAWLPRA